MQKLFGRGRGAAATGLQQVPGALQVHLPADVEVLLPLAAHHGCQVEDHHAILATCRAAVF